MDKQADKMIRPAGEGTGLAPPRRMLKIIDTAGL
jgi:hypothetical protein